MRTDLASFFVFAVIVSIAAFNGAFAAVPLLFAGGWDDYIGSYDIASARHRSARATIRTSQRQTRCRGCTRRRYRSC
jgi:hypothetical protein